MAFINDERQLSSMWYTKHSVTGLIINFLAGSQTVQNSEEDPDNGDRQLCWCAFAVIHWADP